jgi:DNA ligase (NAD+)
MYTLEDFHRRDTNDQRSLTDALAFASYQYYVLNEPPMSDFEFDMEFKQLQALEAASGRVLPNSPTLRVGSDIQGGFVKRRHRIPMQSIENVYSDEELQEWLQQTRTRLLQAFPGEEVSFTYEPKYDGVSISLVYTDGQLTDAVTRGNQAEGESVFENVKTIRNIPLTLDRALYPDLPEYFEVRGEVLMTEAVFRRLNAEREAAGERPFANKRNAAAGSLKQLDPKVTARRGLVINAFAAYSTDRAFQEHAISSQAATLRLLEHLGFDFYHTAGAYTDLATLTDAINAFDVVRRAHELPYDCDGVVVKVNERRHQEYLGLNTTFPNWCKARKFPQEAQSTRMYSVTFQVGMTGHITPVAELEPTVISGSVVARATLNNENYIRSLGLHLGSYVFVQKAGEVIPQVTAPDTERNRAEEVEEQEIVFPTACPCCHTPLERKGEYWICPNHHCREQVVQRLEYWCGKNCANIRGLGPNVLNDLYEKLDIVSIDDLYRTFAPLRYLHPEPIASEPMPEAATLAPGEEGDLFAMAEPEPQPESLRKESDEPTEAEYRRRVGHDLGDGYAERSVAQLFDGVRESIRTLTLDCMIGGFGIDGIAKISGRQLAAHFGTLERLSHATREDLLAVDGIGDVLADNILEFFGPEGHYADYACLTDPRYEFHTTYQAAERLGNSLEGLTVLFTGTSYRFKRDEIREFFTAHGAKYVGSVSGKVNFVVVGTAPGQNKVDKARQLGVEIVEERAFYERFGLVE